LLTAAERPSALAAAFPQQREHLFNQGQPVARLAAAGIPAGKVRTIDDVYGWEQTLSQGLVIDVDHATLGPLSIPGPPLRFFAAGPDGETETTRRDHRPPPVLGGDGEAIRAWLAGATDGVPEPAEENADDGHPT